MNVFLRPNLARCLWVTPLTSLIFMSLTLAIRHWVGMTPIFDSQQMLTIGYIAAVFGFLIGIGAFDTWFPWMIGSPTRPRGPLRSTARTRGATTSGSTPTTR